jgi:hypothetical protein
MVEIKEDRRPCSSVSSSPPRGKPLSGPFVPSWALPHRGEGARATLPPTSSPMPSWASLVVARPSTRRTVGCVRTCRLEKGIREGAGGRSIHHPEDPKRLHAGERGPTARLGARPHKQRRTLLRIDGGFGTDENLNWLIWHGYEFVAKGYGGGGHPCWQGACPRDVLAMAGEVRVGRISGMVRLKLAHLHPWAKAVAVGVEAHRYRHGWRTIWRNI